LRLTSPLNLPAPGRRQCVYGALCGLARTCVFAKQSLEPILCGLELRWMYSEQLKASLLPKLRDHYAEFLDHVSLVHLRLLALPTCVGFRYGASIPSPVSFSCQSTRHPLDFIAEILSIRSRLAPTPLQVQSTSTRACCSWVPDGFNEYRDGQES
jgi:hypothetical protein